MSFTVTMVLTADSVDAFSGLTLGKKLDGGAQIRAFGIGDYIAFADTVREPMDRARFNDNELASAARAAVEAHDASVTGQLNSNSTTADQAGKGSK